MKTQTGILAMPWADYAASARSVALGAFAGMAAWLATTAPVHADTSYLLFQGPFGSGSTVTTYKYQVNYPTGYLVTGQDLLDAVFGNPIADGTVQNDPVFGGLAHYTSGIARRGATYASYGPGSYLALSFTIGSQLLDTDDATPVGTSTKGWNYYVAGGTGDGAVYTPPSTYSFGAYPDGGGWDFSNDGTGTRFISNGSYDGWVYGDTGSDIDFNPAGSVATISDTSSSDNPSDFSHSGPGDVLRVINVTTEGRYTLLLSATDTGATIPQGTGYATMIVGPKGGAIAAGKLPDGESFTAFGVITSGTGGTRLEIDKTLSYPSVTPAHAKGSLAGTLDFVMQAGASNLSGTLKWTKPPQKTGAYRAAIDTTLDVIGSRYTLRTEKRDVLPGFTTGTLELSDTSGILLTGTARLAANEMTVTGTDQVKVTIHPADGRFTGSFHDPRESGRRTDFAGVLFQDQSNGGGLFLGPDGSGRVSLAP